MTSYSYNGFGDLTVQSSPTGGVTFYDYDSAGNLAGTSDSRGIGSTYTYDALNRATQIVYGDQTIAFSYDSGNYGKGRLTGASDVAHSMTWQYDALGRVTAKSQTVGSITKSINYAYAEGNMTTLTTPSGQVVTYGIVNGRITSIAVNGADVLSSVVYDPFGPARGWSWANGTSEVRLYDADGNPSQFGSLDSSSYVVDSAFRIVGVNNASNVAASWTYDYDKLDRLTGASTSSSTLGWTYDLAGNRLSQTGAPGPLYLSAEITPSYNNRGRMSAVVVGGQTTRYVYNALGQRIAKLSGDSGTLFFYDEQGRLVGEYDASGNLIEETVWMGTLPIATLRSDGSGGVTIYYIHADHLNTPKSITRPADNVIVWRWDRDPFGTAPPNQDPSGLGIFVYNLRFPGQYSDPESGFSYNYLRDYDSRIGRYNESDPIGLLGGPSLYAYAAGNPVSNADPTGRCPWCVGAAIGAAIGAVAGGYTAFLEHGADWSNIGASVAIGAVSGAVAGATLGVGSTLAAGTVAGIFGNSLSQLYNTGSIDPAQAALSGLAGLAAGAGAVVLTVTGLSDAVVATIAGIYGAIVQGAVDWNTHTNEKLTEPPGSCSL